MIVADALKVLALCATFYLAFRHPPDGERGRKTRRAFPPIRRRDVR